MALQALNQGLGDAVVVLHYQQVHGHSLARRAPVRAPLGESFPILNLGLRELSQAGGILIVMARTSVPSRSAHTRDVGRRRISYMTRWIAAGGVAGVGLFTGLAARASTPHTTTSTATGSPAAAVTPAAPAAPAATADPNAQPVDPNAGAQTVDPNAGSLQSPDQAPVQLPAPPPPMAVSGGS